MFCENCGRPLLDGEVCTCTQQNVAPAPEPAYEPTAPQQPAPAAPVAPEPAPVYAAPQQPAPAQFVPQQPAPQQFVPQQPAPQQFAPQQPAPQQFAPQQPAPQQFAPQPAPQQFAPQPAPQQYVPQPAPQQPAPGQFAPQPAPQQFAPQPAPQQFAKPVPQYTKPSLDNIKSINSKYPGYNPNYDADVIGKASYNRISVFLSSPIIFVYGILVAVALFIDIIASVTSPGLLGSMAFFTVIGDLVKALVPIAAIITFTSAKKYLATGKPVSPVGLTIASGYYIFLGILLIISASLLFIFGCIGAYAIGSFYPLLIMLIADAVLVFVGIIPMFSASHSFQGVRYLLTNRGKRYQVSLYPAVMLIISGVLSLISVIMSISAMSFINSLARNMGGVPMMDTIMSFLFGSGSSIAFLVINTLLSLGSVALGAVIFIQAKKAQTEAWLLYTK